MYKILGSDQKEYGPVSAQQIIQWINEGRANGATLARAEGTETWLPLINIPEFAALFPGQPAAPVPVPPGPPPNANELAARIGATDYDLDIGGCISGGWRLLWDNFGPIFGTTIVLILIQAALSGLAAIPFVGFLFSIASLFLTGPLMGGLYMVFLRRIRKQGGEVGDLFSGFSERFWQLAFGYIVPAFFTGLSALPGVLLVIVSIVGMGFHPFGHGSAGTAIAMMFFAVGILVAIIPAIYFSVCWIFTVPLVIDKGIDFWPAMGLSHRMVRKHFVSVLALLILGGLINIVGIIACCVGVLFSIPIVFGSMMFAYETIFSGRSPQTS
jgi:hypothetical protein